MRIFIKGNLIVHSYTIPTDCTITCFDSLKSYNPDIDMYIVGDISLDHVDFNSDVYISDCFSTTNTFNK